MISSPGQIKLYPELSIGALRKNKDKELALWHQMRALDYRKICLFRYDLLP